MEQGGQKGQGAFTPGPWRVAYDDQHGQAVVSGEHTEICTCWHHCVGSIEKQMRANAALIAAAPELLEAAIHLLEVGEFCRTDDTESALRKLRAAALRARHQSAAGEGEQ